MKQLVGSVGLVVFCLWAIPARAATLRCAPDAAKVGDSCIDKYEASVWQIDPVLHRTLVTKVLIGKATLADLTAGGATLLGCSNLFGQTAYPPGFPADGNWTPAPGATPPSPGVYAVSIPGVMPSMCTTWFQAVQACAASGKHLIRNEEWQRAAVGTPDPGTDNATSDCNISALDAPVNTGSRSNCKSAWGVFDMVGNANEWVTDWAARFVNDAIPGCSTWTVWGFPANGDVSCFGGVPNAGPLGRYPAALLRGGGYSGTTGAGVFYVDAEFVPATSFDDTGFRCAR
jgi:formylglycine-generating enzyme required for sulfatase activity